jgi:hypothetical protein
MKTAWRPRHRRYLERRKTSCSERSYLDTRSRATTKTAIIPIVPATPRGCSLGPQHPGVLRATTIA